MSLLEVNHLKKIYTARYGGNSVQALADVNFTIENGEYTAIMGESGSGKTTLLNIIATLDRPTSGTVRLEGQELSTIPERRLAEFRRKNLGFVFQDFNLLDTFSIRDNILLPLVLDRTDLREMAVSYTHLDVYKRQPTCCAVHWTGWACDRPEAPSRRERDHRQTDGFS